VHETSIFDAISAGLERIVLHVQLNMS